MGLWKSFRNLGLGLKLTGMVTSGMVALLVAAVVIGSISAENITTQAGRGRAEQEVEVIQGRLREAEKALLASAGLVASRPGLGEAVVSGDTTSINMIAFLGASALDLDDIGVMGSDGAYITTVMGDALRIPQNDPMVLYALLGIETTGVIIGDAAPAPSLVALAPLRDESGNVVGALSASRRIDDALLEERNFYRDDVHLALIADGQILAQDFPNPEILGELSGALIEEPNYESVSREETVVANNVLRSSDGVPYALAHSPYGSYARAYSPFAEEETIIGEADDPTAVDASIAILVDMSELNALERRLTVTTAIVLASLTLVVVLAVALFARGSITRPIVRLRSASERMASGDYQQVAEVGTKDEVGQLASAFNTMSAQLQQTMESLERRTDALQRRSIQLQASSAVGRAVASILDVEQLIRGVVDLIRERFNLYYVGLFLLDTAGEWAVLQAGTGEAGRVMLARGHRIKVGEGMVGWSIAHAQARVAEEVGADAMRLATEELPDTRSEAALALRSRGQVLGALTVQSDQPGAFDEQTVAVLQTMADQVAVAIDNARLYDESQAALEAERRAYGVQSRAAWAEHLRVRPNVGYYCDGSAVTPISERAQVPDSEESPAFSVPLVSRGQVIGTISARRPDGAQAWTKAESQLLETLAEQLGQALESARLYQDSLRRTAREQLVGEVTARVRETLDMETVLKVAAQELRQSLGLPEVMIRLAPDRDRD
jgi:GAF domain-containing protein/HAMP domain-containing protein